MSLTVDVVAPDRVLWKGMATSVSAPTVEGSIGILRGHEPVLSVLRAGTVKVVLDGADDVEIPVVGGFLSFDHDVVTIIADTVDSSGA